MPPPTNAEYIAPSFWPRLWLWLARSPTPAAQLRQRQQQFPPQYDSQNSRTSALRRRLPPELDALLQAGRVSIGEVGELGVFIHVEPLPVWGYFIEFSSGFMRLNYSVARALGAATRVFFPPPRPPVQPVLTMQQFAGATATMMFLLRDAGWVVPPQHPIDPEQREIADDLTNEAEYFLMMHELAHVWIALRSPASAESLLRGAGVSWKEEFAADHLALLWSLGCAWSPASPGHRRPSPRMVYAGAEFALRVLAFMEHLKIEFERTHPLAQDRLEMLRLCAQALCAQHQIAFDSLRTIAMANNQYLDAAERVILGQDPNPPLRPEELRATLTALFEEAAKGMVDLAFTLKELETLHKYAEPLTFIEAARAVRQELASSRSPAAQILEQAVAQMPPDVRNAFQQPN